ncbi:MAG TPA: hypothetical protein VGN55_07985 [Xanthobacteraceae bacterium]|jgi:hypothetical protein
MPPVQPSLRGSLLTGASALALSVSASGAHGQAAPPSPPPRVTVWGEGALFWTGGPSFNVPTIPGLGAPFTSFNPKLGLEGAVGFDYQWPSQPWHFVFDIRYGRTKTASVNGASSSSSSTTFQSFISVIGFPVTNTTTVTTANSGVTRATEWESHLVADFMIGRDFGVGTNRPEFQFGFRVADLHAVAQAQESGLATITTDRTFYAPSLFHFVSTHSSTSTASSAAARWSSGFFGVGPRLAVAGGIPIAGPWSFDYSGGIAALIGDRTFNVSMWSSLGPGFATNYGNTALVLNADGWAAISYAFTPHFKASAGLRGDVYGFALTTYDVNTGGLVNISRFFGGPFVRFTGAF